MYFSCFPLDLVCLHGLFLFQPRKVAHSTCELFLFKRLFTLNATTSLSIEYLARQNRVKRVKKRIKNRVTFARETLFHLFIISLKKTKKYSQKGNYPGLCVCAVDSDTHKNKTNSHHMLLCVFFIVIKLTHRGIR